MYSFLELDEDYIEMDCEKVNKLVNTYVVYDKPFTPVVDVWGYYDYIKDKYLYPYIPNQNLERTTLISEAKYPYLNYTVMYHCTRWLKNFFYSANLVSETDFDTIGFNVDTLNAICEDLEVPYPDWDYYKDRVVQSLWDYDELSNKIDELVGDSEYSDNSVVFKNPVKAKSRDLVSV